MKTYRSAVTILFLSAALLVGCSSGGEKANPSVPAYTSDADSGGTAAADSASVDDYSSAEASASSTSATDGPLTAEGLSDPATEYTVLSIPDDLDELQQEALRAYIAYDRATWEGNRTEDGDLSAVEATTSGDALEHYKKSYDEYMKEVSTNLSYALTCTTRTFVQSQRSPHARTSDQPGSWTAPAMM